MEDFVPGKMDCRSSAKLEDAAWICGDDRVGFRPGDGFHFLVEQFKGSFRLRDVVNASGAAAEIGERHFNEFYAGNRADEFARSFANLLAVREMARVLVSDAQGNIAHRSGEAQISKKFRDIKDVARKLDGVAIRAAGGVVRTAEKMWVFLQSRAAAGGVGKNRVKIIGCKRGAVFLSEIAGDVADSSVRRKRPAADLAGGDDDFASVGLQNANRGAIQIRERDLSNAAREEGDTRTASSLRGKVLAKLGEEEISVDLRHQPLAVAQTENAQNA